MKAITLAMVMILCGLVTIAVLFWRQETNSYKAPNERISIVYSQTLIDSQRWEQHVLILRDIQSGKEYLAIRGAGITEIHTKQQE